MPTLSRSSTQNKNMKILQLNIKHCEAEHDLLRQAVVENKVDVVLLSETFVDINSHNWMTDSDKLAAIWVVGNKTPQNRISVANAGFTWAKLDDLYYVSCYAPPRWSLQDFEHMMTALEFELRGKRPILIAGDFNAWSRTWGSRYTTPRGRLLEETMAAMDLVLLNTPGVNTFDCASGRSIIDLAFADSTTANRAKWMVDENLYTHSDHLAIVIEIKNTIQMPEERRTRQKWKRLAFHAESFQLTWRNATVSCTAAEDIAEQISEHMKEACDAAMPRCRFNNKRKPVYWWTKEIASIRKACNKARRRAQRARHRPTWAVLHAEYRERKFELKTAIKQSKTRCFEEMRNSADHDPWGLAYRTVMQKVRGPRAPQPTCHILLSQVVTELFPQQEETSDRHQMVTDIDYIPPVTTEEVLSTLRRIKDNKAPGPDGVPNIAFKAAVQATPEIFANMYEACLNEGTFPRRWKLQRLVLLLKAGKQPNQSSAYRPLCMLDTVGKVFERIICDRLQSYLECPTGLSDKQFGFRRARSTVDAIRTVTNIAHDAISGGHTRMKFCAIITLDVKNAFNSARWSNILLSLRNLQVPGYLIRIIRSYFRDRILQYDTDDGLKTYKVTGGVPQGSVLGPSLWNAMYDGVLSLKLPDKATLVGYADDIALVVTDKKLDHLQEKCNDAAARVHLWLSAAGLKLAVQKTEAVLVTARRTKEFMKLRIGGHEILSQEAIKYLGVMIDARLCFKQHLATVGSKAAAVNGALTRILPNIGGPQGARRHLLASVVDSVILYAAPIWAGAKPSNVRPVAQVHRRNALRVACAYRTVSDDAVCVIAGKLPIDILVHEMGQLYDRQGVKPTTEAKAAERLHSLEKWQSRWDSSINGRWTYRLIPKISQWVTRRHGDVDHYLTQILSGHGCFLEYLHRFHLEDTSFCPSCNNTIESAEHVFFYCDRFNEERRKLELVLGEQLSPERLINNMCASHDCWNAVKSFAKRIIVYLQRAEWQRKTQRKTNQPSIGGGLFTN